MQTLLTSPPPRKATIVGRLNKAKEELAALLHRIPFGEREAKIAVVFVFTVCWLLIVLIRSQAASDPATLERSSLPGLAAALQQGSISGRDFQSTYGPGAQLLAWIATAVTATRSATDAYGMIAFFFCAASALLAAVMLLICDQISWQQCAVFYAFSIFLNLFFNVFDIRTIFLLLNAVVAYRTIAAETLPRQIGWATASGLLCFVAQLITTELGICVTIAAVLALVAGSLITRRASALLAVEVFVATFAAANLGLAVVFKLTSPGYGLLFDYQNYSLELLRGYHNSMGILWGFPLGKTIALAIVTLYVIGTCAAAAWTLDPLEASFLASLMFAAVLWLKTALVRSDIPQIILAFTPVIVILSLLATIEWRSPERRVAWVAAVCATLVIWPSLSLSAPTDLVKVLRGKTPAWGAIRGIYARVTTLDTMLRATLNNSDFGDRRDVAVLAFPYGNYIPAGLHRPFFAPVLESDAASTESLEQYYVRSLDSRRRAGLEIVYGPDNAEVPPADGVQALTRTPIIFEYLYKYFELESNVEHAGGHYILRPRPQPRDVATEQLDFSMLHQLGDSGILKLNVPSACGLILVELRIDYAKDPAIFRPSGIKLNLSNNEQFVWKGSIMPLAPNQAFATYISPLPPGQFHQVFGEDPVQSVKWDRVEYHALNADLLGSAARLIHVNALRCVDPKKFVTATSDR